MECVSTELRCDNTVIQNFHFSTWAMGKSDSKEECYSNKVSIDFKSGNFKNYVLT